MNRNDIVDSLRAEISHLQKILEMMEQLPGSSTEARGPGRPKGSPIKTAAVRPEPAAQKRVMSTEGKARIAAAQKKRWAKVKRASTESLPSTQPKAAGKRQSTKATKKAVTKRPAKKSAGGVRAPRVATRGNAAQPRKAAVKAPAEPSSSTE